MITTADRAKAWEDDPTLSTATMRAALLAFFTSDSGPRTKRGDLLPPQLRRDITHRKADRATLAKRLAGAVVYRDHIDLIASGRPPTEDKEHTP